MPDALPTPLVPFSRIVPPVGVDAPSRATPRTTVPEVEAPTAEAMTTEAPGAAPPVVTHGAGALPKPPALEASGSERVDHPAPVSPPQLTEADRRAIAARATWTSADAPASEPPSRRARRWGLALALVLASAALGFFLAEAPRLPAMPASDTRDLLALAAEQGRDLAPDRATTDRDAAARFAREATGLGVTPPSLDGYALTGVGTASLADDFAVPYFVMERDGERVPVYALTYAHLDAAEGDVVLARPVVNRIAAGNVHVEPLGSATTSYTPTALVWRDRATIYLALTERTPEPLADAIR